MIPTLQFLVEVAWSYRQNYFVELENEIRKRIIIAELFLLRKIILGLINF